MITEEQIQERAEQVHNRLLGIAQTSYQNYDSWFSVQHMWNKAAATEITKLQLEIEELKKQQQL